MLSSSLQPTTKIIEPIGIDGGRDKAIGAPRDQLKLKINRSNENTTVSLYCFVIVVVVVVFTVNTCVYFVVILVHSC